MSARERRLDFLVWWRCFRNSVYMTFSFRSAFNCPLSMWLSMMVSVGGKEGRRERGRESLRRAAWQ